MKLVEPSGHRKIEVNDNEYINIDLEDFGGGVWGIYFGSFFEGK